MLVFPRLIIFLRYSGQSLTLHSGALRSAAEHTLTMASSLPQTNLLLSTRTDHRGLHSIEDNNDKYNDKNDDNDEKNNNNNNNNDNNNNNK